jgi:Fe-S cluster assembly protein SufD
MMAEGFAASLQAAEARPQAPWQAAARQRLSELGVPTRKLEDWRYTDLDRLLASEYQPETEVGSVSASLLEPFIIADLPSWRLVLVNGQFLPQLSDLPPNDLGLSLTDMRQAMDEPAYQPLDESFKDLIDPQPFSELNKACASYGLRIDIAEDCRIVRPIEVLNIDLGGEHAALTQARIALRLGARAEALLIERHVTHGASDNLQNLLTEVQLDKGASLRHYHLQELSGGSKLMHQQYLLQDAESDYQSTLLSLGDGWSRSQWRLRYRGAKARSQLDGAFIVGAGQYTDHHLDIHHDAEDCHSEERFHGLLGGNGRGVFDGKITVHKTAHNTHAALNNHNLLLSRDAEIDTKPQLLIYADDVACSHGTTVGQIDQNALFYLRSRGIAEQDAARMICHGFVRRIYQSCAIDPLKQYIEARVAQRLASGLNG